MSGPDYVVLGGSHGVVVQREQAAQLGTLFLQSAQMLQDLTTETCAVGFDGDLVESAVLSPATFAEVEAAILAATSGPQGLLPTSLEWELDGVAVVAAVAAFARSDEMVAAGLDALDYRIGLTAGYPLGNAPPLLLLGGAGAAAIWPHLPGGVRTRLKARGADAGAELQRFAQDHPEIVERAFNSGGGLVDGFWRGAFAGAPSPDGRSWHPSTAAAAGMLAALFPSDGTARVTRHGRTGDNDARRDPTRVDPVAPRGVRDLIANLSQVAALSASADSAHNGTIAVQTLAGDTERRHIVYLPGTDDLATLPHTQDHDVRDSLSNLHGIRGEESTHSIGVRDAMAKAGIRPGEQVLLVGHSQGGMVAHTLANHPGEFQITDVVTAGSPLGEHPVSNVRVLALENTGDLVPHLDGESNGEDPRRTTLRFRDADGSIVDNHDFETYEYGAGIVDSADDLSLRDAVRALSDFLGGSDAGEVQVLRIERQDGAAR